MRLAAVTLVTLLSLVSCQTGNAQEPRRLSGPDTSATVWGVLEIPHASGPHPGVVILHGSFGWRPAYAQFAGALADSGFVALAINCFAETGRDTIPEQRPQMQPRWQAAIRSAVDYLRAQPFVNSERLGLVGFSRGAFLAVSVASSMPAIKAVVDYFGGIDTSNASLEDQVRDFPALLILHGEADTVVPVSRAYQLRQAVIDRGGEVEMHIYPGAQHAFSAAFSPSYSETAAVDSFRRTIGFLRRRLENR
jgi:carboxymethylenebutenolidase